MTIRSCTLANTLGAALLAATGVSTAATASDLISPSSVLAHRGPPRGTTGFMERTARIQSITGPEAGRSATLRIPVRPSHGGAVRRDADASAGLR